MFIFPTLINTSSYWPGRIGLNLEFLDFFKFFTHHGDADKAGLWSLYTHHFTQTTCYIKGVFAFKGGHPRAYDNSTSIHLTTIVY